MFTWHTRSDRIRSDKPSEGRGRKGKGDDQAGCLSQGKEKCVFERYNWGYFVPSFDRTSGQVCTHSNLLLKVE